jgi:hypothetical protein
MTRFILKAIDVGASAVFMALCTKAFFVHFYKDVERQLHSPDDARSRIQPPGTINAAQRLRRSSELDCFNAALGADTAERFHTSVN